MQGAVIGIIYQQALAHLVPAVMLSVVSLLLLLVFGAANASHLRNGSATFAVPDEEGYVSWIRKMGSFRHEVSDKVKNKVKPCLTIKVSKKGSGGFVSVQKAIDSLPNSIHCRVLIMVGKGTYREKVSIPNTKAYITMVGAAANKTIIEWDDTAERMGRNGHPMGTYGSATFSVDSPYFIARHIQFKNSAPSPPSGALGKQAVALRISGDMAAFIDCKFIGAQDTLYDHMGRHYFKRCYIQGSVDFIFGNGLSFYESCHLHAITTRFGALTAQSRESFLEQTGFSFFNCRVTGSGALYLGRAWGTFSRVVFAYTYMDKIIIPKGWNDWGDKNRDMTVFYGQYKCSGPGADFGGRVSWSRELTKKQAEPFTTINFIDGQKWLRNT